MHAYLFFIYVRDNNSRSLRTQKLFYKSSSNPKKISIPNTIPASNNNSFVTSTPIKLNSKSDEELSKYSTPKTYLTQNSYISNSSNDDYKTPEGSFFNGKTDIFSQNFNELQKSSSTSVVEQMRNNILPINEIITRKSDNTYDKPNILGSRLSLKETEKNKRNTDGVLRSKSEFEIPKMPLVISEKSSLKFFNSDLLSFLTPRPKRKNFNNQVLPSQSSPSSLFKVPPRSPLMNLKSLPETRTSSLSSLSSGITGKPQPVER